MKINLLRQKIDQLDRRLLNLLNQRTRLTSQVGRWKRQRRYPVLDRKREETLLKALQKINKGPLNSKELRVIYRTILSVSKARQRALKQSK